MEGVLEEFAALVGPLEARAAAIPFCSTVHGRFVEGHQARSGVLDPQSSGAGSVRRRHSIHRVRQASIFLEIAPHPVLAAAIEANLQDPENLIAVLPSLRRGKPSLPVLDESLARLYAAGCTLEWAGRYPRRAGCIDTHLSWHARECGSTRAAPGGGERRARGSARAPLAWESCRRSRSRYARLGANGRWAGDSVLSGPRFAGHPLALHLSDGGDDRRGGLADARHRSAGARRS